MTKPNIMMESQILACINGIEKTAHDIGRELNRHPPYIILYRLLRASKVERRYEGQYYWKAVEQKENKTEES